MFTGITEKDLIDFEKGIAERFDNGEIPYLIHLSGGNEKQLLEIFQYIKEDDYVFSTHRNHYHYLLHGGSPKVLEDKILNGKSMFVFDRKRNFLSLSIVAATPSIAAGVAWALKREGSKQFVWCFVGDGAEDEGHFYEAVRFVDGWDLPCVFIIEDNDRSVNACKKVRRGTINHFQWPRCVWRYSYKPKYCHGGTGSGKWLEFKKEAKVLKRPKKKSSEIPVDNYRLLGTIPYQLPMINGNTSYFDAVKMSMEMLAKNFNTIFIGYNVRYAYAYGALKDIPDNQKLETPLAENLMMGIAMGMSLEGYKPIVFFERHDFILNAIDAIVNTLDIIHVISDHEYHMPVVIKAVAGSVKPFYAGLTHTNDLAKVMRKLVSFPIYMPEKAMDVVNAYKASRFTDYPIMVSERKELY